MHLNKNYDQITYFYDRKNNQIKRISIGFARYALMIFHLSRPLFPGRMAPCGILHSLYWGRPKMVLPVSVVSDDLIQVYPRNDDVAYSSDDMFS